MAGNSTRPASIFSTEPPALEPQTISALLKNLYGLEGTQKPLVSERDQNIRVCSDAGNYVLKISNAAENRAILELQNQVLEHLQRHTGRALAPVVIAGRDGQRIHEIESGSGINYIRLLTYLDGQVYSDAAPSSVSLEKLGRFMGRLSDALTGFWHPAAHRPGFLWNLDNVMTCRPYLADIADQSDREMIDKLFRRYEHQVKPGLESLRLAVIHQDANDMNIIVDRENPQNITGLIDFGDLCLARQVNELAILMAYALQGQSDIYLASQKLVSGYTRRFRLGEDELEVLFDLVRMRLAMSVCISSNRAGQFQDNEYLLVSQRPALELLRRMAGINPAFMTAVIRKAAGLDATRTYNAVTGWLSDPGNRVSPLFGFDLDCAPRRVLPLEYPGDEANRTEFSDLLTGQDLKDGVKYLIGLYGENRPVYTAEQFASPATPERRSIHLGLDIFTEAGTPLYAPLPGRVHSVADNDLPLDYGPTVILEHRAGESGSVFYTLYGHLSGTALELLTPGQQVESGQVIGHIGAHSGNGGWTPHLHFQIMIEMLGQEGNFNGVGEPGLWPVWREICPDPNLVMKLAPESFASHAPAEALLEQRKSVLGTALSISYRHKLNIVRGRGAYLYDHSGRRFLDCVNNICHVGHCHPHVVEAMARQARILNTNTRYLNETRLDYARRLAGLFPDPLSVVFFVNSGTEANELALRIARAAAGRKQTIVLDWAYHGNSSATVEISPYKFKRSGGFKKPDFVEIAEFPDPYRGRFKGSERSSGKAYADSVAGCIATIRRCTGQGPAVFIAESVSGVGGQVVYPQGYLQNAYDAVRAAGGICIADEVQCGFGRLGSHLWGFETQGVVPDIVVMGKPMGNGHPLAAVVTTPELANAFDNGMEYFNSFGGNPVSMAVGNAVLDVIENQSLQQHANKIGNYLLYKFNELKDKYDIIGDVRGSGLFLGLELVEDRGTLKPAPGPADWIVNILRDNGVLLSTDGPNENVLKFKPPMVFSKTDADVLCEHLEKAFTSEVQFHPGSETGFQ